MTQSFPQYVRELQGIADGSQVEFYKVKETQLHTRVPTYYANRVALMCYTLLVKYLEGHRENDLNTCVTTPQFN